jgi:hypothetical protein
MDTSIYSHFSDATGGDAGLYSGVLSGHYGHKNRTVSDLSTSQTEGINMSDTVKNFHDAKVSFIAGTNAYADTASAMVTEYMTDAKKMAGLLVTVMNADYPVNECKDNPVLKTALNSCQRAVKRAGEGLPDSVGGVIRFAFSTATDAGEKVRTVSAEYLTQGQVDTIAARIKEDTATEAKREEEDKTVKEKQDRVALQALTDLDVFLRWKRDFDDTYPDHDIRKVMAAGMAKMTPAAPVKATPAKTATPAKKVA